MDQWATEKSDWVNQTPGAVTGHYTTLIGPSYKAYGFGASSADYYGTAYAGEATSASDWDATPTNIQGKYTVEVNLSSAKLAQGIADNVPDTLRVGESFTPVVKAKAYSQRLAMRGMWSSSDDKVLSVQSDGSILAKTGGKATLTFTLTDETEYTFDVAARDKTITAVADKTVDVASGTTAPTLPGTVTATHDDKSTAEVPVTWNKVPNDWNSDRKAHTVKITGKVDGWSKDVTLTLNVAAAAVSAKATVAAISTVATHAPDLSGVNATVTYTDGTTSTNTVDWNTPTADQYAQPGTFDVTGTVLDTTVNARAAGTPLTDAEAGERVQVFRLQRLGREGADRVERDDARDQLRPEAPPSVGHAHRHEHAARRQPDRTADRLVDQPHRAHTLR